MSHLFEQVLNERCNQNSDVAVLRAQWDFDKRLLGSALQAVSQVFPHYSKHDASHSHTILIQIERVLGEKRIRRLSATDLWLLLSAAYLHDSGMIVTNAQLEQLWTHAAFRAYLGSLQHSPDPDFAEAARRLLHHGSVAGPVIDPSWPFHVLRAVRLVVAEYRRREHADRSADVVMTPASIGLPSPRTGLIPDRLFRMLARICKAHGQDFGEVMALPHSEVGVASDVAHPRFAACMLRLGDLLDLDNGRFCPVMLSCMGSSMPRSSLAHVAKHAAIRRLQIDQELISVEAECSSDDVLDGSYEACAGWLDMLRAELQRQQQQWTQIAPAPDFGALPSPGRIEVRFHDLISSGRIEVDPNRVPTLLQGGKPLSRASCLRSGDSPECGRRDADPRLVRAQARDRAHAAHESDRVRSRKAGGLSD
jgi:hypothetical protein